MKSGDITTVPDPVTGDDGMKSAALRTQRQCSLNFWVSISSQKNEIIRQEVGVSNNV